MHLTLNSPLEVFTVEAVNEGYVSFEDWAANVLFLNFPDEFSSYNVLDLAQLLLVCFEGFGCGLDFNQELGLVHYSYLPELEMALQGT